MEHFHQFYTALQGLNKDKDRGGDKSRSSSMSAGGGEGARGVSNSLWVYSIGQNRWSCLYRNLEGGSSGGGRHVDKGEGGGGGGGKWAEPHSEPRPRYAHQLVYDEVNRVGIPRNRVLMRRAVLYSKVV